MQCSLTVEVQFDRVFLHQNHEIRYMGENENYLESYPCLSRSEFDWLCRKFTGKYSGRVEGTDWRSLRFEEDVGAFSNLRFIQTTC